MFFGFFQFSPEFPQNSAEFAQNPKSAEILRDFEAEFAPKSARILAEFAQKFRNLFIFF